MRKRIHILTLLGLFILLFNPFMAVSQGSYADSIKMIKNELKAYESQLERIDQYLLTYDDCVLYSRNFDECVELTDYLYEENKPLILENKVLTDIWFNIKYLRDGIDKKMIALEREQEMEKRTQELRTELSQTALDYDQWVANFQQLGQMKKKAAHDTLQSLKKRDAEMYIEYSSKKTQNKELIAQDPSLDSLCKHIEAHHKTISEAKDIETIKWGDLVFKVTIMTALLFFLINLIVSKKKLKDQMNGKKNKHIPSI